MSNYTVVEFSNGEYGVKRISDNTYLVHNAKYNSFAYESGEGFLSCFSDKAWCIESKDRLDHMEHLKQKNIERDISRRKSKIIREGVEND